MDNQEGSSHITSSWKYGERLSPHLNPFQVRKYTRVENYKFITNVLHILRNTKAAHYVIRAAGHDDTNDLGRR